VQSAAFWLYLAFICSWFLHLPARVPGMEGARADLLLVGLIMGLCVANSGSGVSDAADKRSRTLLYGMLVYAVLTVPLVEWPGTVAKIGIPQFFKAFVFFYFTSALVDTPKKLKLMLGVFLACQIFRVLEPLYLNITEGYWGSRASMADWQSMDRLSGSPYDVVNPNGLAAIILTIIPLLHYLTTSSVTGRLVYVSVLPALLYALVLTASRSGMIGLAAIFGLLFLKSRHKMLLTVVTAAAVAFTIPRLSADLTDRYVSIFDDSARNAVTADERVDGVKHDLEVAMRRPLFGHGLGTSREANAHYGAYGRPSHNLYTEAAQELGFVGLMIFLAYIWSVLWSMRGLARALRETPGAPAVLQALVSALQVWFGTNLLFSFASYGLSSYEWYMGAGLVEVSRRMIGSRVTANAAAPAQPAQPTPCLLDTIMSRS
jgi:hypothetical protein